MNSEMCVDVAGIARQPHVRRLVRAKLFMHVLFYTPNYNCFMVFKVIWKCFSKLDRKFLLVYAYKAVLAA